MVRSFCSRVWWTMAVVGLAASAASAGIINPIVYNSHLVMNNTTTTQSYSFLATPVPATAGTPNKIRGSVTTQVLDMGNDGASIAAPSGGAIYNAQIDGVTVKQMQTDPFSIVVPVNPSPNFVNNDLQEFAFEVSNIPVTQNIGILLTFELSPGDAASVLSQFELFYDESVPEPASLALLGLGGLLICRRRR